MPNSCSAQSCALTRMVLYFCTTRNLKSSYLVVSFINDTQWSNIVRDTRNREARDRYPGCPACRYSPYCSLQVQSTRGMSEVHTKPHAPVGRSNRRSCGCDWRHQYQLHKDVVRSLGPKHRGGKEMICPAAQCMAQYAVRWGRESRGLREGNHQMAVGRYAGSYTI